MHGTISSDDYENFRRFLEESCGIVLGDNKHYLVNSRLNRLMSEHSVMSLGDLVKRVRSAGNAALKERIVDAMTTNETYWFRDVYPFEVFKSKVLKEYAKGKKSQARLWSAACSSGQEPYTLSMAFTEYQMANPGAMPRDLQIVATDISPSMLLNAKSGIYDELSIGRGLSDERKKRYFKHTKNLWELRSELKKRVQFREHNLLQSYSLLGKFDIIFCRNVLIYFSSESKQDILSRMAACLNPGGYLFLGASESIGNYTDRFEMVRCNPGVIYRLK